LKRFERVSDTRSGAMAAAVARRLDEARERIAKACAAAGRPANAVEILAVTKGFGPEAIEAALAVGLQDIGENYLQEAQAKFAAAAWPRHPVRRHFIGHIQRNKARRIATLFDVVQTVSDVGVAAMLDEGARESGKVLDILVQVNVAGDDRTGVAAESCADFVRSLEPYGRLRVRGVMAVGPLDHAATGASFLRACQALRAVQRVKGAVDMLSLGMTGDLEAAVAAGSTMVRLGTALFGDRPAKV
jgi:pyridoxal phosphate enzyme (YggS family)